MPYIAKDRRAKLILMVDELALEIQRMGFADVDEFGHPGQTNPGDVNFTITKLLHYLYSYGGCTYAHVNEAIGILECAKQEFYRRIAVPYEDKKIKENGDVF